MFEDNHMDKDEMLLRSILESGQEDVPAHVWNGITGGLDKISRRRKFLWAGGCVAAAAALAVGVVLWHGEKDVFVPEAAGNMIAVIENEPAARNELIAKAENIVNIPETSASKTASVVSGISSTYSPALNEADVPSVAETVAPQTAAPHAKENRQADIPSETSDETGTYSSRPETFSWEEDKETGRNRLRASLVLSGIAGTNNPQSNAAIGPFKASGILNGPSKTTIEQIGEQTTYGIPLSFGAGVRLHFTKRWSLGIGLNYTLLSSKFNGKYTKVEDGVQSVPISEYIHNTQHYIGIPVNAYYNIISRDFINFYAYAGGTVEKCVGNSYRILTTPSITHEEAAEGVQLSANAGIGVEFMLGRYVGLYLDPSLRYYFKSGQPKSIRTAQPLMLGFELGLRFNL